MLYAQDTADQPLYSQLSSMTFHQIAQELYTCEHATDDDVAHAVVFLQAARRLDPRAEYVSEGLLEAAPKMKNDI